MAKWPEGTNPNPEVYTADWVVEKFWEFRERGREYQSLEEDVAHFLPGCVGPAGRENVVEAWERIMAKKEWDVEQGGKRETSQAQVDLIRGRNPFGQKKGGLRVYG